MLLGSDWSEEICQLYQREINAKMYTHMEVGSLIRSFGRSFVGGIEFNPL